MMSFSRNLIFIAFALTGSYAVEWSDAGIRVTTKEVSSYIRFFFVKKFVNCNKIGMSLRKKNSPDSSSLRKVAYSF